VAYRVGATPFRDFWQPSEVVSVCSSIGIGGTTALGG
jgi:hypothetical protein